MVSFKALMKHTPPPFRVFQEYGRGYLKVADSAIDGASTAYAEARWDLVENPQEGAEPVGFPEEDTVAMYAEWTIADDLLKRLDHMDPAEREKHLKLDESVKYHRTFESVTERHAKITAEILAWEEEAGKTELWPALNRQLKRRLDTWERLLEVAKVSNFEEPDKFSDVGDYCHERTILEYAAMGIGAGKIRNPKRFEPLPYFDEYTRRRSASDDLFRTLLKGRYSYAPWAVPAEEFWWHHPPKQQTKKKK